MLRKLLTGLTTVLQKNSASTGQKQNPPRARIQFTWVKFSNGGKVEVVEPVNVHDGSKLIVIVYSPLAV